MANGNKIKGLTLEIGGDVQPLNKALGDVNQVTRNLQGELKSVERLLKLDPKNTELVAQKQKVLADQVANSAEKLNRLKQAQEQVNASFQNGGIGEEQYRYFQRQLIDAEQELRRFESSLENTIQEQNKLADSAKKLETLFKATGTTVDDFADSLGDKLTRAINNGTASSKQLDEAIDKIGKAALGADIDLGKMKQALASVDDGNSLENVRQELGRISDEARKTEDDVNNLGMKLENVAAGLLAGGGIAGVVQKSLDLASLETKIDISLDIPEESKQAVKDTVRAIEAYGVEGEEALEGVRRQWALNKDASDKTNASVMESAAAISRAYQGIDFIELIQETNEISRSLKITNEEALGLTNALLQMGFPPEQLDIISEYGTQLQMAGYNAEEIQAIMSAGVETGSWNIDNLLDGLKEGRIRMSEFGKEVPKAVNDLLAGTEISSQQLKTWGAEVAAGGEVGKKAMQEVAEALMGVDDETTRNLLGVQIFGTIWEDQGSNIADTLLNMNDHLISAKDNQDALNQSIDQINKDPAVQLERALKELDKALEPVLSLVAGVISKFASWAKENPTLVATLASIAAVLGILLGAALVLAPVLFTISTTAAALGISIGAVAGPVLLITAVIAGLVAGGVALYKNWDTLEGKAGEIWAKIKQVVANTVAGIKDSIGDAKEAGEDIVIGIWTGIGSKATWLYNKVASFVKENIIGTVKDFLGISSPSKVMAEFGQYVTEGLAQGMEKGTSKVQEKAQAMAQAITGAVQTMTNELNNSLSLSRAGLELEALSLSENASAVEKLAIEEKKAAAEKEAAAKKVEILTAAYETSKQKLGENNQTTKQYAHELSMAQVELSKTEIAVQRQAEQVKKASEAQVKAFADLEKEIEKVETKYRDDLTAAAEDYYRKVEDVNRKLLQDEQKVTDEYKKQVDDRARSLSNFVGLFDAVTEKNVSGRELLGNLRGQVQAFDNWQENIAELAARGVDEGLIKELKEMGPKAGPEIAALNTLTDNELTEYVSLWKTKNQEAREEAINQLQQQRVEMQQKLQEIRIAADEQLELYRVEWEKKNAEIRKNTEAELTAIQKKFNETAEAGTKQGTQLILNFAKGMESQFDYLRRAVERAREIAAELDPNMRHSPSLVDNVKSGLTEIYEAYQNMAKKLPDLSKNMIAEAVVPNASLVVGNSSSNIYENNSTINITVQDGEDLVRTLHRLGFDI